MTKQERVQIIINRLNRLYPKPDIPLNHVNDFTLLVAVILSAQCTDKKVNEITPKLFKLASTPQQLAELGQPKIFELIKEIGLAKTKSIHLSKMSAIIEESFYGKIPNNFKDLESLPGVGHKTASVIMAQAFNIPSFPIDTHIHRLSQRWGLTNGQSVKQTEKDLKKLFPILLWNKLHLQIIYYGREHCTARGCDGTVCDICREIYPKRKQPVKTRKA